MRNNEQFQVLHHGRVTQKPRIKSLLKYWLTKRIFLSLLQRQLLPRRFRIIEGENMIKLRAFGSVPRKEEAVIRNRKQVVKKKGHELPLVV